jgi:hypothetical protein
VGGRVARGAARVLRRGASRRRKPSRHGAHARRRHAQLRQVPTSGSIADSCESGLMRLPRLRPNPGHVRAAESESLPSSGFHEGLDRGARRLGEDECSRLGAPSGGLEARPSRDDATGAKRRFDIRQDLARLREAKLRNPGPSSSPAAFTMKEW